MLQRSYPPEDLFGKRSCQKNWGPTTRPLFARRDRIRKTTFRMAFRGERAPEFERPTEPRPPPGFPRPPQRPASCMTPPPNENAMKIRLKKMGVEAGRPNM